MKRQARADARSSGLIDSINDADPEQFKVKFMSALGALTRNNRSADKPNEKKIERIISFIEKNYSNIDLNVSYLSNVFGISINHLSGSSRRTRAKDLRNTYLNTGALRQPS